MKVFMDDRNLPGISYLSKHTCFSFSKAAILEFVAKRRSFLFHPFTCHIRDTGSLLG